MKRKLWTFGDSFSTGESKPRMNNLYKGKNTVGVKNALYQLSYVRSEYKKVAYTTHLSKMLDLEDYNLSVGGMGQVGIVNSIVNHHHLIKNEDIVIVAYSSPFRGYQPKYWKGAVVDRDSSWDGKPLWESAKLYPLEDESILLDYDSYVMLQYKTYIEITERILKDKNFILTQAFNPLFGYYDTSLLSNENKNFIEWGKKNNTLHDICAGTWLRDDAENYMMSVVVKMKPPPNRDCEYLESCSHPSPKGHELIAKTLLPYIERLL